MLQVEFANVLVLNKVDLVEEPQVRQLELLLHRLNPTAKVGHGQEGGRVWGRGREG